MGRGTDLTLSDSRPYPLDDIDDNATWIPYPLTNRISCDEKPALLRYVATEMACLTEIIDDINSLLLDKAYDMEADDLWLATNRIYSRLRIRLERLPDALRIEGQPVPQALFVRVKYHQAVISLFNRLLSHFGHASQPWYGQARQTRLESAKEVARYMHIQRQFYGLKQVPCHMLDAVHIALLALLTELGDDEPNQAFVELCRFLVSFRQRLQLADKIIQMIEQTANESAIELPPEAVAILDILFPEPSSP
ncbi:hypothetical protein PHISCL_02081 [Aspergillus sclerotialis]|uniref:Uncharacterized protein n=1 Tax=Aspergillus sclerotialis TaxID=2070753 RepID=A0A3A3A1Q0_9EURO|nr:hypothetical protein PHISCL_02081 [Aspergillus sclerotialis]